MIHGARQSGEKKKTKSKEMEKGRALLLENAR
jgi:hypothetical protein